jgi:lipopolysaccharide transport protein LptA
VKKLWIIALLLVSGPAGRAQPDPDMAAPAAAAVPTNPPAAPAKAATAEPPPPRITHIDSDTADFDMNSRTAVYRNHVRVIEEDMTLSCGWLIANLPQSGRMNQIVAETNVVIDFKDPKGETMHATSDKAVYHYSVENGVTNETVTLTENPKVESIQGTLTGDQIVWDRANNRLTATNQKMIYRSGANAPETNAPPAMTNAPAIPTNQPVEPEIDTNTAVGINNRVNAKKRT